MKFWPNEQFIIQCKYPMQKIIERLKENTAPHFYSVFNSDKLFWGKISASGFRITPLGLINSFRPYMIGSFTMDQENNTIISIKAGMYPFVTGFSIFIAVLLQCF